MKKLVFLFACLLFSGIQIQAMKGKKSDLSSKTQDWMSKYEMTFLDVEDFLSKAAEKNLFDIMLEILNNKKILFNYKLNLLKTEREITARRFEIIFNAIETYINTHVNAQAECAKKVALLFRSDATLFDFVRASRLEDRLNAIIN